MQTNKHVKGRGFSAVGKPAPPIEGTRKVSGKALYTADTLLPDMIWAKFCVALIPMLVSSASILREQSCNRE